MGRASGGLNMPHWIRNNTHEYHFWYYIFPCQVLELIWQLKININLYIFSLKILILFHIMNVNSLVNNFVNF